MLLASCGWRFDSSFLKGESEGERVSGSWVGRLGRANIYLYCMSSGCFGSLFFLFFLFPFFSHFVRLWGAEKGDERVCLCDGERLGILSTVLKTPGSTIFNIFWN